MHRLANRARVFLNSCVPTRECFPKLRYWLKRPLISNFIVGTLTGLLTGYVFYGLGVHDEAKKAAQLRTEAERDPLTFGFVQMSGVGDEASPGARVRVFVNGQRDFSGVHLIFKGATIVGAVKNDLFGTFEATQGSPQRVEIHFSALQATALIVTCLGVPDTYAPDKPKLAWVRQEFTPNFSSQSRSISFTASGSPALEQDERSCESIRR